MIERIAIDFFRRVTVESHPQMLRNVALVLCAVVGLVGVANAAEGEGMQAANVRIDNPASLQRGARLFFNYCSGCHSLQYLRFSRIAATTRVIPAPSTASTHAGVRP